MKVIHFLALLSLSALLCACAAVKGGTDVDDGRNALLAGNYKQPSAIFRKPKTQIPVTCTARSYGRELRAFWVDHNTSPGTMLKPVRI